MTLQTILIGLGFVFVIEGLVLALAPDFYRKIVEMLEESGAQARRNMGLTAVAIGVVLLWIAH